MSDEMDRLIHERVMGQVSSPTMEIPNYSGNMSDAWKVFQKVAEKIESMDKETKDMEACVDVLLETTWAEFSTFDVLNILATWTPEKICFAALVLYPDGKQEE